MGQYTLGQRILEPPESMPSPAASSLTFLYHELRRHPSKYSYALQIEEFALHVDLFARIRDHITADPSQAFDLCLRPEISFDDGHLSDYEHALPILTERSMAAHFFITVGWTGRQTGYMGWQQLRSLHQAGQNVGTHGWSHTLLTHCSVLELQRELVDSRNALEDKLGCAIASMSLPGGRYNRKVLAACQAAGYTEVFSSVPRAESARHGLLNGRLNVRSGMSLALLAQLLEPESPALAKLKRRYRLQEAAKLLLGDALYARLWAFVNSREPAADPDPAAAS